MKCRLTCAACYWYLLDLSGDLSIKSLLLQGEGQRECRQKSGTVYTGGVLQPVNAGEDYTAYGCRQFYTVL